jgi:hypothetical protein
MYIRVCDRVTVLPCSYIPLPHPALSDSETVRPCYCVLCSHMLLPNLAPSDFDTMCDHVTVSPCSHIALPRLALSDYETV